MNRQRVDRLQVQCYETADQVAIAAATAIRQGILEAIATHGQARIIWATGNSQLACLSYLIKDDEIPWSSVTYFHLDEYLGIAADHPASFRHYLKTRLADRVNPAAFHYLAGDCLEPLRECDRYTQLLNTAPIDLCCLGIGNNGHLAFNEPSVADFNDPAAVKLVKLDAKNREQQYNQGHFPTLAAVPHYAFTLTLSQIAQSRRLLCLAQGDHKRAIVHQLLTGPIDSTCPATLLRRHPHATLLLDANAAQTIP
ncbi:glucosamine-6-phosphate deaminase [Spirulina major CS-329]|uniref:glucosamine-6-phosphate deaminase n=1 Tax=Spirulina TaxID=1154 RepID=UPI0023308407|nr:MULTISPECIES: glucosamine-6-phosphate deaminase [Spirulina]MDB9493267.1 glucosamine-6-phosphate deaminase [Spirulina subsalsa CS-330]MDB9504273.1 glucosamine-6-phosphate deaminase [Spirulina major CS-329]